MNRNNWQGKISNPAQLGGIETAVLDNGSGRGVRVAWINTGSPLRYKVVIDRALDITDAFYAQHSLAWLSHGGLTGANPAAITGLEWLRTFAGGLVTTCGLSHVGGPEEDENGVRGLHGRISNLPGEVISIEQPDPANGVTRMAITAVVRESSAFGPFLELRRTISSELGVPEIRIADRVCNRGNSSVPHMLLYHCNLGWPLVDEGAELFWHGETKSRGAAQDDAIFASDHNYRKCPAPMDKHCAGGEGCGFIRPVAEADGKARTGVRNDALGLTLTIEFDPRQLPHLANWQHWGPGEYVTGLEPGTNPPVGQGGARAANELIILEPGETRDYELVIKAEDVLKAEWKG
jgi:hypothetical protein